MCFTNCFGRKPKPSVDTPGASIVVYENGKSLDSRASTALSGDTLEDGDVSLAKEEGMDPFSILAGVVSFATAGIQASKKLYELLDDVKGAPEEIYTISQDAHALFAVMYSLEIALKKDDLQALVCDDSEIVQAVENLTQPLRNCQRILDQLMEKIAGRLKRQSDGQGFRMSSFDLKWGFSTKNEVKGIMRRLESNKSTLNAGMTAITTIVSIRMKAQGKEDVAREIKRASGATNAGYALQRYLAESIIVHDPATNFEPSVKFPRHPSGSHSTETLFVETPAETLGRTQRQRDELHHAARNGDTLVLARLVAEGADINSRGDNSRSALAVAMENSHEDAALFLLEHGCDFSTRSVSRNDSFQTKFVDGRTPLIWAAAQGLDRVVRKLIQMGADVNAQNNGGRYALQEAIRDRYVSTAKILIEEGNASVSIKDSEDWTPLLQCADQGVWEVAELLIARGADLEARSSEHNIWGWKKFIRATPLLIAVEPGHTKMVEVLCAAGANMSVENVDREMPVHVAARQGKLDVLKALLAAGTDVNAHTIRMETPLMSAILDDQFHIVEFLVKEYPESVVFEFEGMNYGPRQLVDQRVGNGEGNRGARMSIQGLMRGAGYGGVVVGH